MAPCTSCSLRKLIARPSPLKVEKESHMFLERIQGDICGPIHPAYGPFRYFMVLIDTSSRWSHVSLLSTRNVAFAKFLAQIIKLRAHFPDYTIKRVRLDNAGEFTSQAFNDYCMSVGIVVEHPISHVHTQNGLAESLIKRLQLIARPLIMRTKLPVSIWGHAILHAASLIRMRPSANHVYSPMQLAFGQEPNISHLSKLLTRCSLNTMGWSEPSLLYLDPRTKQSKIEVQKIMHMQEIANQLPDAFTDTKRVTRSYIPAVNAPARDIILEGTQNIAPPEEEIDDINKEVSIKYGHLKISLDQIETEIIDEKFCYNVACDIMNGNNDPEPTSVIQCQSRHDWNKWKEAMKAELNSLNKRKVFG
ncbi:retrovirus-related pol polyprotein from transposon TNT 1-94 [Tanacetum coccineum]